MECALSLFSPWRDAPCLPNSRKYYAQVGKSQGLEGEPRVSKTQYPTDMRRELRTVATAARASPHLDFTMSIFPAETTEPKIRENTNSTVSALTPKLQDIHGLNMEQKSCLTGREVDVSEENDVGGDQRNQFSDANLLLKMDVDNLVLSQGAVHTGVKVLQP
uniref:Uncharacterized protein n=1 Tax=Callorhinchus milii TaxID=7868 RepID=A0A4W3ID67_CALMI